MARAVADATGASLYAVVQPKTLWWHVPSIRYDPAESRALASFIANVRTTVSLHGYGEPGLERTALLGGNNRALASVIHAELAVRDVRSLADLESIPKRLRGVHRLNPVNLPSDAGVQIELPMELREGRSFELVAEALVAAISSAASRLGPAVAG